MSMKKIITILAVSLIPFFGLAQTTGTISFLNKGGEVPTTASTGELMYYNGQWLAIPLSKLEFDGDSLRGNISGVSGGGSSIDTTLIPFLGTYNEFTKSQAIIGGSSLIVKDATNVDDITISHDGTYANIVSDNTIDIEAPAIVTYTDNATFVRSIRTFNTSSASYPLFNMGHARGTKSSPMSTLSNYSLGKIIFEGYSNSWRGGGEIQVIAKENYSFSSTGGTYMEFKVNPNGAVYEETAMILHADENLYLVNGISMSAKAQDISINASTDLLRGANLSVSAGNTTAGGTADLGAGMLSLNSGISKGTGVSSIRLTRNSRQATTSTTLNSLSDAFIIPSEFNLTDEASNSLFEISLESLDLTGGEISFSISISDGTDLQSYTGIVIYSAVNKAGVYTTTITEGVANSALSSGTLSTVWSVIEGTDKITIAVTPTSSLTPTIAKISYTITNNGSTTITQL